MRDEGLLDVGRAVRKVTLEGADLYGIPDRGVLAPGAHADVNVIDLAALDLDAPEMVVDLPLGASRFVQRGRGYDCTMVNGWVLVDHDELTDERPGAVVSPAERGLRARPGRHAAPGAGRSWTTVARASSKLSMPRSGRLSGRGSSYDQATSSTVTPPTRAVQYEAVPL